VNFVAAILHLLGLGVYTSRPIKTEIAPKGAHDNCKLDWI